MPARRRALAAYIQELRHLRRKPSWPIQQEGVVYHCPLDARKRHNLALQQASGASRLGVDLSLPHIVHIGVTTHCNLSCPACPTGTQALGRRSEHLDFAGYKHVVDELRSTLLFMLFWDWGEPFLHPRLPEMIAHAGQSGIHTVVSTNGTIPDARDRIERFVAAQPSLVIVCVDGATQESYERYRIGGRLKTVLATLELLAETRERLGLRYPVIEFRSLATRDTERQLPELLRLADDTGADFFSLKNLRPYDYRGHDIDDQLVPLSPDLARYAYDSMAPDATGRVEQKVPLRCGKPLHAPTLNSDGELVFCSYARYEQEKFGRVTDARVRQLWHSRQSRAKRRHYLEVEGTPSCEHCYFRGDHAPTVLHTVPLRQLPGDVTLLNPEEPGVLGARTTS